MKILVIVAALCSVALAETSYSLSFTSEDGTVKKETGTLVDGIWIVEAALTGGKVGKHYFNLDKAGLTYSDTPQQDETGRISAAALASLAG